MTDIVRRSVRATNVADSPSPVNGVFVLPNNLLEHTVFEVTRTPTVVFDFGTFVDISEITKSNFRLRLYMKIDGVNYRLHNTYTFSGVDEVAQFDEPHMSFSFKVTAQSNSLEGAARSLPYTYTVDPR